MFGIIITPPRSAQPNTLTSGRKRPHKGETERPPPAGCSLEPEEDLIQALTPFVNKTSLCSVLSLREHRTCSAKKILSSSPKRMTFLKIIIFAPTPGPTPQMKVKHSKKQRGIHTHTASPTQEQLVLDTPNSSGQTKPLVSSANARDFPHSFRCL